MGDGARSSHPAVQEQLDRLQALSAGKDVLGLTLVRSLCERLGNPQDALPPVFHVAGTNGKGSTIAFLRAAIEGAGGMAHVFTSPHLVRFNERIRIAGELIGDEELAALLEEVLDAGEDIEPTFFETTTAAAFLAFARTPADATLVEVGLGGRLDATNIVSPVSTGIAALGMDHMHFLGDSLAAIAGEKAGIAKAGVPLVTMRQPDEAMAAIECKAEEVAAPWICEGRDWWIDEAKDGIVYRDRQGELELPRPALAGAHQPRNLGLATAMLRHQDALSTYDPKSAALTATWPARLQTLPPGKLTEGLESITILLDGAHNAEAARSLAASVGEGPFILMSGILKNRPAEAMFEPFQGRVSRFIGLPVSGHDDHDTKDLSRAAIETLGLETAGPAGSVEQGFQWLRDSPPERGETILIMGSLYLAGDILRLNGTPPG